MIIPIIWKNKLMFQTTKQKKNMVKGPCHTRADFHLVDLLFQVCSILSTLPSPALTRTVRC